MGVNDAPKVHAVKLVPRQDQHKFVRERTKMNQVAPHGISRALIPVVTFVSLLSRQDIDETSAERIESKRILNMPMKRRGVELRKQKDAIDIRIKAVADGNIYESIFACQRHGWFAALFGERIEACSPTARPHPPTNIISRH